MTEADFYEDLLDDEESNVDGFGDYSLFDAVIHVDKSAVASDRDVVRHAVEQQYAGIPDDITPADVDNLGEIEVEELISSVGEETAEAYKQIAVQASEDILNDAIYAHFEDAVIEIVENVGGVDGCIAYDLIQVLCAEATVVDILRGDEEGEYELVLDNSPAYRIKLKT